MRIANCKFTNFGSYDDFTLNLEEQGLALIYGNTGAGKSTIMDMVCWGLFGVTAKDGRADDVRSWGSEDPTTGEIEVDDLVITRTRGKGANDLYFAEGGKETLVRGKDITETQKLINSRLGIDYETFVAGAYMHEFSPTGSFFTAKAKERRQLFEKLAVLDLPNKLSLKSAELKKASKVQMAEKEQDLAKAKGKYEQTLEYLKSAIDNFELWEVDRAKTVVRLEKLIASFGVNQTAKIAKIREAYNTYELNRDSKLQAMDSAIKALKSAVRPDAYFKHLLNDIDGRAVVASTCATCGQPSKKASQEFEKERRAAYEESAKNTRVVYELKTMEDQYRTESRTANPYKAEIERAQEERNIHSVQLFEEQKRTNPWTSEQEKAANAIIDREAEVKKHSDVVQALGLRVHSLTTLNSLAGELRAELLRNAVQSVEERVNDLLTTYFDAEIRVELALDGSDDLDVTIHKSGYECNYKQLSKGQRGLLNLCFSVSVMEAISNSTGVQFNNLFLDESLDGLDSDLKTRAFSLFQALSKDRQSVFVIDHAPELQNMFHKRFHVTMESDRSVFHEES